MVCGELRERSHSVLPLGDSPSRRGEDGASVCICASVSCVSVCECRAVRGCSLGFVLESPRSSGALFRPEPQGLQMSPASPSLGFLPRREAGAMVPSAVCVGVCVMPSLGMEGGPLWRDLWPRGSGHVCWEQRALGNGLRMCTPSDKPVRATASPVSLFYFIFLAAKSFIVSIWSMAWERT